MKQAILEAAYQDNEMLNDEIEALSWDLMKGDYSPADLHNFHEAIAEDCLWKRKAQIEEAMHNRDFAQLGRIIWSEVTEYWEKLAENEAAEIINSERTGR